MEMKIITAEKIVKDLDRVIVLVTQNIIAKKGTSRSALAPSHVDSKSLNLLSLNFSNSRSRPRKSPEASGESNSENFKRSYEERDSARYRERETRNRH